MSQNTKNGKGFFIGFLVGGAVGAAVALLTTPKSGEDLKKELKQKSDDYLNEVDKYISETKNNAGKVLDISRRKFETMLHDMKSKPDAIYRDAEKVFKEAKGKTIEAVNSGKEIIETETERLTASVKAGIDSYNEEKNN